MSLLRIMRFHGRDALAAIKWSHGVSLHKILSHLPSRLPGRHLVADAASRWNITFHFDGEMYHDVAFTTIEFGATPEEHALMHRFCEDSPAKFHHVHHVHINP